MCSLALNDDQVFAAVVSLNMYSVCMIDILYLHLAIVDFYLEIAHNYYCRLLAPFIIQNRHTFNAVYK
jgi:hypothetical protein